MCFGIRKLLLISFALILAVQVSIAVAEYIDPGSVIVKTTIYKVDNHRYPRGEYTYDIEWQGLDVGRASVRVRDFQYQDVSYLFVEASAKSAGAVDWFYRLRHKSESLFKEDSYQPLSFTSQQTENKKEKLCEVSFQETEQKIRNIHAQSWKNGKKADSIDFNSSNLTFDPISAAFYIRAVPFEVGKEVSVDVFNGKHRFIISFKVLALETIKINKKSYLAYKIQPSVKKLTDTEGETKLKNATLWVSADANRDVLKLDSKVWIGSVTATLRKYNLGVDQKFNPDQLHAKLVANNP